MNPDSVQLRPCMVVSRGGAGVVSHQYAYLEESVDEVVWQPGLWFFICAEVLEHM
jgi:hypothetical protein